MAFTPPLVFHLQVGETFDLGALQPAMREWSWTTTTPALIALTPDGAMTGLAPGIASLTLAAPHGAGGDEPAPLTFQISILPPEEQSVDIRPHHPRLRYTAAEIAERRRLIASGTLPSLGIDIARQFEMFLEKARRFRDEVHIEVVYEITGEVFTITLDPGYAQPAPVPQPIGFSDYPYWTRLSREIEQRLVTLAMAWSLTGDRSFAEKARTILLAISGWRTWAEYDKPTNNLSLPHFTMGAAIAYDEIYSILTEPERQQVRHAISTRGLHPMGYWRDRQLDHNITVLMNAGMVVGCLAIGDELPHTQRFLAPALVALRWYLEQRETSTITEGLVYISYSLTTIFKVAAAVRRATGDDTLLQSPYIRSTLPDMYLYLRGGHGGYANLSDSREREDFNVLMMYLLNELNDPRAIWLLAQDAQQDPMLFPYLQRDTAIPDISSLDIPLSRHFERIDWVALRSGWSDQDTLLAFTSSPSATGHNHFDQNHFVLNVRSEWLITDPGYQTYTPGPENVFTTQTIGHNGLLVNGEGQSTRGGGRIIACELGSSLDYVCGDATASYEGRLDRWHRHIIFAKPGYILIVDDIVAANPDDRIDLLFHTEPPNRFQAGGCDLPQDTELSRADTPAAVTIQGEQAAITLQFLGEHLGALRQELFLGAERFGPYLRAGLTPASRHLMITAINLDPAIPLQVSRTFPNDTEHPAIVTVAVDRADIHQTHRLPLALDAAHPGGHSMHSGDRLTGVA